MNEKENSTPIPEPIPFGFGEALVQLKAGLRVVDVNWGTGEWLELKSCPEITGLFIQKYNRGVLLVFQPDTNAMLLALYSVVK